MLAVCLALAMAVWAIYGQTRHHEFVNFDDNEYVYENAQIRQGLSLENVRWAFTHLHVHNWHPLTTLSYMLDVELYGLAPAGHHLTSVVLHAATAILLFLLLRTMTGALWPSAFVAAAFAVHPLRVESVAWIAERKDVLSGLFFMLTLLAYVRYIRRRAGGTPLLRSGDYWLALLCFAAGLMSKPMLVTVPFVLLLLDYWPLQRIAMPPTAPVLLGLLREKLPFLLLAVASSVVTIIAQGNSTQTLLALSLPWRVGNALVASADYVRQLFYPVDLAVFYPHPGSSLPLWKIGLSATFLAVAAGLALASWRRRPWVLVGWLWYLGMLVPVIGILQVGSQASADRYTYLPQIGLYIVLAWGAAEISRSLRQQRVVLASAAAVVLAGLMIVAHAQTEHWSDSLSLWRHTLAHTANNARAHRNLGAALGRLERYDEAITELTSALKIEPGNPEVVYSLGVALARMGRTAEAIARFQAAIVSRPGMTEVRMELGSALVQQGRWEEALAEFREEARLNPANADALSNLGMVQGQQGLLDQAIGSYQAALVIRPDNPDAQGNLGTLLGRKGRWADALVHFEKALVFQPGSALAHNNIAWLLATCPEPALRDGRRAAALAQEADRLTGGTDANSADTLAAAYAEAGQYSLAVDAARRALQLAITGNSTDVEEIRRRLQLYSSGLPYHEPAHEPTTLAPR